MKSLITLIFSLCSIALFAQKKQNVYFLKDNGAFVNLRDSADFIRVVTEPDSGSVLYNVFEYYPNGTKKLAGRSSTIENFTPEGTVLSYYKNGNKKTIGNYNKGVLTGLCYDFFPNGKPYTVKDYHIDLVRKSNDPGDYNTDYDVISCADSTGKILVENKNGYYIGYDSKFKYIEEEGTIKDGKYSGDWKGANLDYKLSFKESYTEGVLNSGTSTDSLGIIRHYTQREISPKYKGGMVAFGRYLSRSIKYPKYAVENEITGKVILKFTIKKDGTVKDIKVLKSPHQLLADEAVRVISVSNSWQTGIYYGIPVNVYYMVPIAFDIK